MFISWPLALALVPYQVSTTEQRVHAVCGRNKIIDSGVHKDIALTMQERFKYIANNTILGALII